MKLISSITQSEPIQLLLAFALLFHPEPSFATSCGEKFSYVSNTLKRDGVILIGTLVSTEIRDQSGEHEFFISKGWVKPSFWGRYLPFFRSQAEKAIAAKMKINVPSIGKRSTRGATDSIFPGHTYLIQAEVAGDGFAAMLGECTRTQPLTTPLAALEVADRISKELGHSPIIPKDAVDMPFVTFSLAPILHGNDGAVATLHGSISGVRQLHFRLVGNKSVLWKDATPSAEGKWSINYDPPLVSGDYYFEVRDEAGFMLGNPTLHL